MRTVPRGRRRLRAHQAPVAALAAVILLTGLAACDAGGNPELDHLREQMEQGVDDARASAEGVQQAIEGAGLDEATRAAVEDAVASATDAIGRARTAIEDEADAAGPAADQAVAEARAGLEEARAKVSDAAATTEGAVRRALDSLGEQIDRLTTQIDGA